MLLEVLEVALEVLEVLLELLCLFLLVFLGFSLAEGTKIAGFRPTIALDSPLGGQEDCGKGPSCMGEGGVLPKPYILVGIRTGAPGAPPGPPGPPPGAPPGCL